MKIEKKHFEIIDSTSLWAKNNLRTLDKEALTVIYANEQTEGYGQKGRKWLSPNCENLYMTFCFCMSPDREDLHNIAQCFSVPICEYLRNLNITPQIKWPNDIQIDEKKLGGVLVEVVQDKDCKWILVGIGLNIGMPKEILDRIDQPATALKQHLDQEISSKEVLEAIATRIGEALELFKEEGWQPFYGQYIKYLKHTPGNLIEFSDGKKGTFLHLNENGSISVKTDEKKKNILWNI